MIAIIAEEKMFLQLEKMNQYDRYDFYTVKATTLGEIVNEIDYLSDCSHVIVDLGAFSDSKDSQQLLENLVDTYTIIVLASGLSPYDVVVRDFYNMGITFVVTSTGESALRQLNTFLLDTYTANSNTVDTSTSTQKPVPEEEAEKPVHGQDTGLTASKIKTKQMEGVITIAFAGGGSRIGTTTQLLQTAWYLNSLMYKVAIVDLSNREWLQNIEELPGCSIRENGEYNVQGFPWYTDIRTISRLRTIFDYILFDYGDFSEIKDTLSFAEKDIQVIVCGSKPQEQKYLPEVFTSDAGTYWYLFSFVSTKEQSHVKQDMSDSAPMTLFAEYTPDYFKYCGNDALYSTFTMHPKKNVFAAPKPRLLNRLLGGG